MKGEAGRSPKRAGVTFFMLPPEFHFQGRRRLSIEGLESGFLIRDKSFVFCLFFDNKAVHFEYYSAHTAHKMYLKTFTFKNI
jgi:hypothetical protein